MSGGTASITISTTTRESHNWYTVANDGESSATSSTWTFTIVEQQFRVWKGDNIRIEGMRFHY